MKAFSILKSRYSHVSIFVMFTLLMQGCIVSGMQVDKSDQNFMPDASTVTGSIAPIQATQIDSIQKSDQLVIRDKIALIQSVKNIPTTLNWDNKDTGSQGVINNISEKRKNNQVCRSFQATRAAFDGVSLYNGQVCQVTAGIWTIQSFNVVE